MNDLRLVIGNKNHSSWSMCPWLLLKMFDVDFEEIQIALYQDNTAEKLGPYSPSLKVPVLLHREITVWDSLAICEYISEQFINGSGWPASPKRRASARSTIARIDAIWSCCRRKFGENGNYLYGRFSVADCMYAPIAACFDIYGADLSHDAHTYMQTLLDNPFVQKWLTLGRREKEPMKIAYASSA